jgi:hypothetical protein
MDKEDFETAVLRSLLNIQETLTSLSKSIELLAEFDERLGEAIELLANKMDCQFEIKEDARA